MKSKSQNFLGTALTELLLIIALLCVFALSAVSVLAETGASSFGITNATFANAANITTMGQQNVSIKNHDFCTIVFQGGTIATNACNQLFVLSPVDGNNQVVSNITWTLTFPQTVGTPGSPTTNWVCLGTNLDRSTLGAYDKLRLVSSTNQSPAGALQSPALTLWQKTLSDQ